MPRPSWIVCRRRRRQSQLRSLSPTSGGWAIERGAGSASWEGRVAALERGGRRATLETGGMRVTVAVEDLEPIVGGVGATDLEPGGRPATAAGTGNAAGLRLERARSVASSLDLRGARVDEALEALSPLPRRRLACGPRPGADHPRPRDRRPARCGPIGGGEPPAGEVGQGGRARRRRRRSLHHPLVGEPARAQGRVRPRSCLGFRGLVRPSGRLVARAAVAGTGRRRSRGGGAGIGHSSVGAKIPPQLLPYGKKPLP